MNKFNIGIPPLKHLPKNLVPDWGAALLSSLLLVFAWSSPVAAKDGAAPLKPTTFGQARTLNVPVLSADPVVDGQVAEWPGLTKQVFMTTVNPALEQDPGNVTGMVDVEIRVGVFGDRFYLAARWPDKAADTSFRPWRWNDTSYQKDKKKFDDGFAVRFQLDGDYDSCMLSNKDYRVDLWHWSAGRTNAAGLAEDRHQTITQKPIEGAAEYDSPFGVVYIMNRSDAGDAFFINNKAPKLHQGDEVPSIALTGKISGSIADVVAQGVWKEGYWYLEMSRLLNTGHDDDAILGQGKTISSAIAIFNHAANEHKSVSDTINLVFPQQ